MEPDLDISHARTPKQRRSQESYDRMIKAAVELLKEGGLVALTLSAVRARARVSIGSIYCRVENKEALVREVQAVVLQQMEKEFAVLVNRVRRQMLSLRELVPVMVSELAHHLRRYAPLLAAFMQQAERDPLVEEVGRKAYQQNLLDFQLMLLERKDQFQHPNPEHATRTCFSVVYASLARYLGLNSGAPGHQGAGEGNWQQLVEDLGAMSLAFMMLDISRAVDAAGETRRPRKTGTRAAAN
jgi:AcrR family transcriptional regulator